MAVQIPVDTDPARRSGSAFTEADILHPLQPLTRDEISLVSDLVRGEMAELGDRLRFEMIELNEPAKAVVRGFVPGDPIARQARVNVYRTGGIGVWRLLVSLTDHEVIAKEFLPEARPMIQLEEFLEIEAAVKRDPSFIEACARRGITDMSLVCVDPWSAGNFGVEGEEGRHLSHAFCWVKSSPHDNLYAHPIEGLNPVVDIKRMEVIRVDDYGITPVPQTDYNYDREFVTKTRSHLRAIDIEQPEGVSFTMEGRAVRWHDWSLVIGFNAREAITLHDIRFAAPAGPATAPRSPRWSCPTARPSARITARTSSTAARSASAARQLADARLRLPGRHPVFRRRIVPDLFGEPRMIENAICLHEEDAGLLGSTSTSAPTAPTSAAPRQAGDLVDLDRRQLRVRVLLVPAPGRPHRVRDEGHGHHQHRRLPSGRARQIRHRGGAGRRRPHPPARVLRPPRHGGRRRPATPSSSATRRRAEGQPDEPYGNAFYVEERPLRPSSRRSATSTSTAMRYWKIVNPNMTNWVGRPSGFKLEPGSAVQPFTHPDSPSGRRGRFIRNHLWVTPYDPDERFPAGEFVNQSTATTACRPGPRRTARSRTPTSSSGTASACTTCRDRRTTRSSPASSAASS